MIKVAPGVYELPNGKFLVRVQHDGRRTNRVVATLEAAVTLRNSLLHELASGELEAVSGDSMRTLGGAFLRTLKGRDTRNPRSRWEKHVLQAPFAARHIRTVDPADVLDWLEGLDAGWQTRRHVLNLVRAFYNWALQRRIVASNPCVGLKLAKADGDEDTGWQPGWYLTLEEQADLLKRITDAEARRMVTIALFTGVRLGELLCLHVDDVHAEHIEVRFGSWDPKSERYRPPKGKAGSKRERPVALFGAARAAMAEQLAELEARRAAADDPTAGPLQRARAQNPLGLVFPSRWGGRRTKPPKAFTEAAKGIRIERLGAEGHPWWHLLRHTCCTALCAGWWGQRWELRDVQAHAGHASMATTQRYAHLIRDNLEAASSAAHAAWAGGNGVAMVGVARSGRKPRKLVALPEGLEPSTCGFEGRGAPGFVAQNDPHCHAIATAVAALEAVDRGEPTALARCVAALRACVAVLDGARGAEVAPGALNHGGAKG